MGMHKSKELKEADLEQLTSLMQHADNVADFKRFQCVYLRSKGFDAQQVADLVQYSVEHMDSLFQRRNNRPSYKTQGRAL